MSRLLYFDRNHLSAFMADVIRRARLDLRHGCEEFSGRRGDVLRLRDRLQRLAPPA